VKGVPCKVVAIFLHYSYLTTFFCNNIMAWDIYKTFGQKTILSQIRSKRAHLSQYIVYAYGIPACIVAIALTIEFTSIAPDFAIGYGISACWIGVRSATIVFFCLPMLYVILTNAVLYVLTILSINYVSSVVESEKHRHRGRSDLVIYVRIFSVLGFTWIFGVITFFFHDEESLALRIVVFLFVIFNSLQVKKSSFFLPQKKTEVEFLNGIFCRGFWA
jgi:G protein-coupled receptor Mth (Methuselah protein)